MDHSHMPIHLPKGMQQPKLSLAIHKDAMSGFNLELMTANFHMVPPPYEIQTMAELMDAPNSKDGKTVEGHAHLYINGEKISRVYSRYLHLPGTLFKKGVNQVTISLNNHAHMPWHSDKKQILATLVINPDLDKVLVHRFESFPVAPQAAKK